MLSRWGRAVRGENLGEAKRDTGFVKSIFGSFGYQAPAVDDADASRERADTMIFHMDVDKITKLIDGLDKDTKMILYIRFVYSNNEPEGCWFYGLYCGSKPTTGDYRRATKQSIAIFESIYSPAPSYSDSANAFTFAT